MTWPPELDALIAAPAYHRLAMENENVRVLETRIEPGESVPIHTHQWPSVNYFLSWSHFVRRDENGEILLDSKAAGLQIEPGEAYPSDPLPAHTLENVGDGAIHVISVELKPKS